MSDCSGNTFGLECKRICGNCRSGEQCHHVNGICLNGCKKGAAVVNCDIGIWHFIWLNVVQLMSVSKNIKIMEWHCLDKASEYEIKLFLKVWVFRASLLFFLNIHFTTHCETHSYLLVKILLEIMKNQLDFFTNI